MTATVVAAAPVSAPSSATAHGWSRRHYALIGGIALLHAVIRAEMPLGQDMLWGARFGTDFLDSGHLARSDSYSWTAHGRAWVPNSWGWNVVLGVAYRTMGIVGFWLLGAALAVVMALVVARIAERIGAPPLPTVAVYVPVGLLGLAAAPRAQTVSTIVVLLIPALVSRLVLGSGRAAVSATGALILLQIGWINIHSGALIGPFLVLACGGAMMAARRRTILVPVAAGRLALATVATALACLLTPYGTAPIRHANDVRKASVGLVTEWDHVGFGSVAQLLALLAVITAAALTVRVWHAGRPSTAACLGVLTVATADAVRFLPMLAVLAAPEVALVIARLNVRPRMFAVMVGATAVVLSAFAVLNARDLRSLGDTVSPSLVRALPAGCRLLNDDMAGDAVILLRPDTPVSLDGRYDMYGREIVVHVENLFLDRPGTDAALVREGITCVLGPTDMSLVRRLSRSPQWTMAGRDGVRTLLIRTAGAQK